jgi:hypothetical protein
MINLYRIQVKDEAAMLCIIQEEKIPGTFWPNGGDNQVNFELQLTNDELLVLRLKLPFTYKLVPRPKVQA